MLSLFTVYFCAVLCLFAQSYPTLFDPMDGSPPGSSVQGDSLDKNTGVGCHALLQGIFSIQGSNPGLLYRRRDFYPLSHQSLLLHAIKTHSSVQSLSRVQLFVTPWTAARQAPLSITNYRSLLKLISIVGDAIQPSHPQSSPSPLAFNLSQHLGLFKWVSSSHQVAKVLEFQFQHHSFQWIFRTDIL